jgi:hypothetical protein
MLSYNQFLLESKNSKEIIVYHVSDSLEHMLKADFRLEYSKDASLFGKAIYFSTSLNILYSPSSEKKIYKCKFSIIPEEPILDLNKEISVQEANKLLKDFISLFKIQKSSEYKLHEYNFKDGYFHKGGMVQYGEFFEKIAKLTWWDYNKFFKGFIQNLGFNSFKHYQTAWTDFSEKITDYGTAYGLYGPKNIKYIDGPF